MQFYYIILLHLYLIHYVVYLLHNAFTPAA